MGIIALMNYIKNLNTGVKYMLIASFTFAIMGAFAKLASPTIPSLEVVFFRNLAGVIIVGTAILKEPMKHIGGKPYLLFFRGFIGFIALLAFFYNIAHISLGDAMTYSKTSPIFTAVFAYLFLHEKLSFKGWLAIFVGFIGILFITQPSDLGFSKYDLLGIFSGVGAALAYTSVRELKSYYDTRAIVLSFMMTGTLGPLVLFMVSPYVETNDLDFIFSEFVMPEGIIWLYLLLMGVLATISQLLMTKAYGEAKAGVVGAVSYSNIFFSIIVGVLLGDMLPSLSTTFGIVLIILAGIMVAKAK
ncbi:MAG TPA: DMT family transporter [Sulfurimonas sp.]|nr:DMT family transporter [Sulfurimonas sp.]HIM75195.1 DMT family transporter [Campylobacterales bacterium]